MEAKTSVIFQRLVREAERKVMRENEPVLLVFSVCDGEIILEKGEILSEKRHPRMQKLTSKTQLDAPHLGQAVPPVLCPRELLLSRSIMGHLPSTVVQGSP
jgi:hypothetical protein